MHDKNIKIVEGATGPGESMWCESLGGGHSRQCRRHSVREQDAGCRRSSATCSVNLSLPLPATSTLEQLNASGVTSVESAAGCWRCGRRPRCHCKSHARLQPLRLLLPRSSLSSTLPSPTPPPTRPPLSASERCQRNCPSPRPTLAANALPRCGPCCCRCCALPASNELPELPPALPVAHAPPGAHRPPRGRARGPRTGGAAGSRAGAAE